MKSKLLLRCIINYFVIVLFFFLTSCHKKNTNSIIVYGSVKDIDGNTYKTIKIGSQIWMAENLRTTRYQNGDTIPYISSNTIWASQLKGAQCCYNNTSNSDSILKLGRLYNNYALNDFRGIAPLGWRAPNDKDWVKLKEFIELSHLPGEALSSPVGWTNNKGNNPYNMYNDTLRSFFGNTYDIYDIYGFTSLPNGSRQSSDGSFNDIGFEACFWSSTYKPNGTGSVVSISGDTRKRKGRVRYELSYNDFDWWLRSTGCSVRCIKGAEVKYIDYD